MNDYIVRFRKICAVLLADKTKLKGEICQEAGMTHKTFTDLLNTDDEQLHLHASTPGKIQDFVRKYNRYENLDPKDVKAVAEATAKTKEEEKKERKAKQSAAPKPASQRLISPDNLVLTRQFADAMNKLKPEIPDLNGEFKTLSDFMFHLQRTIEVAPQGTTITISITK